MDNNGNGGATVTGKIVLELVYDCVTFQVAIAGQPMPISLAQMIVDEGARALAEQRRMAAALQLQQQMAENARAQAIVDSVRGTRH